MKQNNCLKIYLNEIEPQQLIIAKDFYVDKINGRMTIEAYYKALERLTKTQFLVKIAKGIYTRPQKTRFGMRLPSDQSIASNYINNGNGVVVGYQLYNSLNITTQISKNIQIYSRSIDKHTQNIGNISIKRMDLDFTPSVKSLIEMLDILENYYLIQDINYAAFLTYCQRFSKIYNDNIVALVLGKTHYGKRTIAFLKSILNFYETENSLNRFLSALSVYKIPSMEKINEFARTSI